MTKQIPLCGKKGAGLFALVDDCDYEALSPFKWYISPKGYVTRHVPGGRGRGTVYMHRQITDAPKGKIVDHKDGDGTNNTRTNIRVTTQSRNVQNARPRKNKISRYKGVAWSEQRWHARIQIDRRQIGLGYFTTQRAAAFAYNEAATKLFGEFAWLNEIVDDPDDQPIPETDCKPSRFRGVCWDKRRQKWMARLQVQNKTINVGRFVSDVKAAKAYDAAARIHHGQKAKLNFP